MKRLFALLLFVSFISAGQAGFAQTASAPSGRFANANAITGKQMQEWLTYIASDELEGRDTPSKGLDLAAKYIADHLKKLGIRPGGDEGTYFQKFPLRHSKLIAKDTKLDLNGEAFEYGTDFLAQLTAGAFTNAPLVFVGNGWVIKSKNIDSYKGIDVKGKVIVVVGGPPAGLQQGDLKGPIGGDWMTPTFYAQENGAKGVINFPTFNGIANWASTKWNQADKGSYQFGPVVAQPNIPVITVSPRAITTLFLGEKFNAQTLFGKSYRSEPFESFDLKADKRVSGSVGLTTDTVYTQNVVGILEGSDPVLKNEYVAVGSHYDHVGMNPFAVGKDKIWNGADDDGSGTVATMAIAEAFAKSPQKPKRSMIFIWHAGEEKGLWGSEYFTANPTVPITSIITELNIDMIGRAQNANDVAAGRNKLLPKNGEVFLIGSKLMSTELGELSESVNKSFLNMSFNYKYDDPNDPEQYFYRSDHFNYAKRGIPIIFYMDGDHVDYHQVTDSIEKIDFDQMEKVARTIFATGFELANRATRPKVDKPLPANVVN